MYIRGDYVLSALAFTPMGAEYAARQTDAAGATGISTAKVVGDQQILPTVVPEFETPTKVAIVQGSSSLEDELVSVESDISPAGNLNIRSNPPIELPGNLTSCPSVELIFARGTGEPVGLGKVGVALWLELLKYYPDMTAYGVNYNAKAYQGSLISHRSLQKGAKDIENRIGMWEWLRGEKGVCRNTKIVLGGYSLGMFIIYIFWGTKYLQAW